MTLPQPGGKRGKQCLTQAVLLDFTEETETMKSVKNGNFLLRRDRAGGISMEVAAPDVHRSKPLLIFHQGFKPRILNPLMGARSLHRALNQRELSVPARTTPLALHYHRWH